MKNSQQNNTDKTFDEQLAIMQEAVKQAGDLFLNNVMCAILKDFRNYCHGKDERNDLVALHTANVFLDFILDRLAVLKLCSSSTGDMTLHECENLNRILNQANDNDDTDEDDSDSEE